MKAIDIIPIFSAIALAILCYALSDRVSAAASGGLLLLAGGLVGWSLPRLSDIGKKIVVLALLSGSILNASACHNVTPDQFFGKTVDCARVNPEAPAALSAVTTCLMAVMAQNPAACLAGLVTELHFTIDEVACVAAYVAQQGQDKVALGKATADDLKMRQAANDWLVQERIAIRNAYRTGK
jgi:hypothetical protein